MLALTRKRGESIVIGDNIVVTVLSVTGDSVKIGVDAPRSIPVNRNEIYQQILEQNRKAALNSMANIGALSAKISKGNSEE